MRETAAVASLQHPVVVRVDRQVRVHVAVARVHVQRDEHAAPQHACVGLADRREHGRERPAVEQVLERRAQLGLPRHDARVALQRRKRLVDPVEQVLPARAHRGDDPARLLEALVDLLLRRTHLVVRTPQVQRVGAREERRERVGELQLVADRQLDVDPLDAVGVVAQARQRNHDVLVDLERVGVLRDRGGPRAVEPELPAALGRHRDEALGAPGGRHAHDLARGAGHRVVGLADDVADQHHLRPAVALGLGRVADGASRSARRGARGPRGSRRRAPGRGSA